MPSLSLLHTVLQTSERPRLWAAIIMFWQQTFTNRWSGQQNFNMGAVVGMILLFPADPLLCGGLVYQQETERGDQLEIRCPIRSNHHPGRAILPLLCSALSITLAMLLFFAVALFASLIKLWPYNLTFTLDNYNLAEAGSGSGLTAFRNSILISLISAFLGTFITFVGAYMMRRRSRNS